MKMYEKIEYHQIKILLHKVFNKMANLYKTMHYILLLDTEAYII